MLYVIIVILIIVLVDKHFQFKKLVEKYQRLGKELEQLKSKINSQEISQDFIAKNSIESMRTEEQSSEPIETGEKCPKCKKPFKDEDVFCTNCGNRLKESFDDYAKQQVTVEKQREKAARNDKELKNITILVTGAICIVLSAVVFLMSTWSTIPDLVKTMVLVLLTTVFFGGSYVAKKKFGLDKASLAFFYIAMAYIPICLLSISIFGLIGTYLSVLGEGRYIYFMLSSILVAIIYYYTSVSKNNQYLFYGSILSQVLSILMFSLIFSNSIVIIGINLLLYNILLMFLTKREIFIKIYNIIPTVITFIAIIQFYEKTNFMAFMIVLLAINFLILELRNNKPIYSYMFNILLMVSGIYTLQLYQGSLGTDLYYIFALSYILLAYALENFLLNGKDKKYLVESLAVVTLVMIGLLHFESFINTNVIKPYVISVIQLVLLAITYKRSSELGKMISSILMPIYFIVTGINVITDLNLTYHVYISFAFITFIIGEMFRKKDKLIHLHSFAVSHVLIGMTYMVTLMLKNSEFVNDIIYAMLLMVVHIYSYVVEKNKVFKYLSYISSNFLIFTIVKFFLGDSELVYYIPMMTTLIIMCVETAYKNLKDIGSDVYLAVSQIIAFACVYFVNNEVSTILVIVFAMIITVCNTISRKDILSTIPILVAMPAVFNNNFFGELQLGLMIASVEVLSVVSCVRKDVSIFTVFSGFYLLITSSNIDSVYLREILFIIWALSHFYFVRQEKSSNLFKFLVYLSILLLYNTAVSDLGINAYTAVSMLRIYYSCDINIKNNINKLYKKY